MSSHSLLSHTTSEEDTKEENKTLLKDKVTFWRVLEWPEQKGEWESSCAECSHCAHSYPYRGPATSFILRFWVMGRVQRIHLFKVISKPHKLWLSFKSTPWLSCTFFGQILRGLVSIQYSDRIHLITETLCLVMQIASFLPTLSPGQPPIYSLVLWVWLF